MQYGFYGNQYKRAVGQNIWLKQDFLRNISTKVLSKYLQLLGSKFHFFNFPHYKSMEIIFIKNIKFVKVNMMDISTKSLPHRAYGFWGDKSLSICSIFCILVSMEASENEQWATIVWLMENYSRNISIKVLSKYLKWLGSKFHFSIFSIISLWKLHSYQNKRANFHQKH